MTISKPRVFIASSVEGLRVAKAINSVLDYDTTPTLWQSGTFRLGSTALDDLLTKSSEMDFAVFVFTPDDVSEIRESTERIVRDNVVFELGLFIGAIGKTRCFIVQPRATDMHIPTDLIGVNKTSYVADRPDGDVASAVNHPCTDILNEIARQGRLERVTQNGAGPHFVANPPSVELRDDDLLVLTECASSTSAWPSGVTFGALTSNSGLSSNQTTISIIKLCRLGHIDKTVQTDQDGDPIYYYSVTENGMDTIIASEEKIIGLTRRPPPAPSPVR